MRPRAEFTETVPRVTVATRTMATVTVASDSGQSASGHSDSGHRDSGHSDSGHSDSGHSESGHSGGVWKGCFGTSGGGPVYQLDGGGFGALQMCKIHVHTALWLRNSYLKHPDHESEMSHPGKPTKLLPQVRSRALVTRRVQ